MRYLVTLVGRDYEIEVDGERVTVGGRTLLASLSDGAGPWRQLLADGHPLGLALERTGTGQWAVTLQGDRWEVEVLDERTRHLRGLTGAAERGPRSGTLRAPMPGLVVRVEVEPGQTVAAGAGVIVLEAMKMENELKAAGPARVKSIRVQPGEAVEKGQPLVEFDPHP